MPTPSPDGIVQNILIVQPQHHILCHFHVMQQIQNDTKPQEVQSRHSITYSVVMLQHHVYIAAQESAFNPSAQSWVGARGLMQVMPHTATRHGVSPDLLYQPNYNIRAAALHLRYIQQQLAIQIRDPRERILFTLAAYNAGLGHVTDAIALAAHLNRDSRHWSSVSQVMLLLQQPAYNRLPVVRHGYARSSETVDYVERVVARYQTFKGFRK